MRDVHAGVAMPATAARRETAIMSTSTAALGDGAIQGKSAKGSHRSRPPTAPSIMICLRRPRRSVNSAHGTCRTLVSRLGSATRSPICAGVAPRECP